MAAPKRPQPMLILLGSSLHSKKLMEVNSSIPTVIGSMVIPPEGIILNENDVVIVEELGRGAYGRVYKARLNESALEKWKKEGWTGARYAAIKRIQVPFSTNDDNGHLKTQIGREIAFLKKCTAEEIVQFRGCFYERDGRNDVSLCMEYMEYGSLAHLQKRCANLGLQFPEFILLKITRQVICALAAVENLKGTHRDLKPDNILVNAQGEIKLGDFGFVNYRTNLQSEDKFKTFCGAVGYMPMDECNDITRDVWALGLTIIELAKGRHPLFAAGAKVNDFEAKRIIKACSLELGPGYAELFQAFILLCVRHEERLRPSQLVNHPVFAGVCTNDDVATWVNTLLRAEVARDVCDPERLIVPALLAPVHVTNEASLFQPEFATNVVHDDVSLNELLQQVNAVCQVLRGSQVALVLRDRCENLRSLPATTSPAGVAEVARQMQKALYCIERMIAQRQLFGFHTTPLLALPTAGDREYYAYHFGEAMFQLDALAARLMAHPMDTLEVEEYEEDDSDIRPRRGIDALEIPRNAMRLDEAIGQGGCATVYAGEILCPCPEARFSHVAIKVIQTAAEARGEDYRSIQNEITLQVNQRGCDSIVKLLRFHQGRDGAGPRIMNHFLVMERMDCSLYAILSCPERVVTWCDARRWMIQIASGLAFLHGDDADGTKGGIRHCDIKSLNILIDHWGNAKLSDFGLSIQRAAPTVAKEDLESSGDVDSVGPGTLRWMAPEMIHALPEDLPKLSRKADVYAFGCVAHEIASRLIPWCGKTDKYVAANAKTEHPFGDSDSRQATASRCEAAGWPSTLFSEILPLTVSHDYEQRPKMSLLVEQLSGLPDSTLPRDPRDVLPLDVPPVVSAAIQRAMCGSGHDMLSIAEWFRTGGFPIPQADRDAAKGWYQLAMQHGCGAALYVAAEGGFCELPPDARHEVTKLATYQTCCARGCGLAHILQARTFQAPANPERDVHRGISLLHKAAYELSYPAAFHEMATILTAEGKATEANTWRDVVTSKLGYAQV